MLCIIYVILCTLLKFYMHRFADLFAACSQICFGRTTSSKLYLCHECHVV